MAMLKGVNNKIHLFFWSCVSNREIYCDIKVKEMYFMDEILIFIFKRNVEQYCKFNKG